MKEDMLAYCGLDCSKCPAFVAKQADNYELRKKTADEWTTPGFSVMPDEVFCDGCKTTDGTRFKYCASCNLRNCASNRGAETCAHCDDFGCELMNKTLEMLGEYARSTLESIRESLR
jgi:hypothetical protein